jgi:hypothetical protein
MMMVRRRRRISIRNRISYHQKNAIVTKTGWDDRSNTPQFDDSLPFDYNNNNYYYFALGMIGKIFYVVVVILVVAVMVGSGTIMITTTSSTTTTTTLSSSSFGVIRHVQGFQFYVQPKKKHSGTIGGRPTKLTKLNVMPLSEDKVSNDGTKQKRRKMRSSSSNNNNNNDSRGTQQGVSTPPIVAPTRTSATTTTTTTTAVPLLLLDFNASGSIGSLLMQMQKKEEELRKLNKTLLDIDQAVELDPINNSPSSSSSSLSSSSSFNSTTTPTLSSSSPSLWDIATKDTISGSSGNRQEDLLRWMRPQSFLAERWDTTSSSNKNNNNNNNKMDDKDPDDIIHTNYDEEDDFTSGMAVEKAKELDDAVSVRLTSSIKDVTILDLPDLYQVLATTAPTTSSSSSSSSSVLVEEIANQTNDDTRQDPVVRKTKTLSEEDLPRLSRPEHYEKQIGRDMRHLAVSIASCVDDVAEWRLFCEQSTGGLMPLVQCIRDGATSIREGREISPSTSDYLVPNIGSGGSSSSSSSSGTSSNSGISLKEESFLVASSACRALRDLCALSQDLAVVITDGLLRANSGYEETGNYSLMDDISTLLRYADEMADVVPKSRKRELLSIRQERRRRQKQQRQQGPTSKSPMPPMWPLSFSRARKKARLQCKLYATQLLLAMTCASDSAVDAIRSTEGLQEVLLDFSSYARKERRRRWIRYPGEIWKDFWLAKRKHTNTSKSALNDTVGQRRRPFIQAASPTNDLNGRIQANANQVLAAIGYNEWVPKIPGQKGLRILCLDGGGSRGMTAVMACKNMVDSLNGLEIADGFDLVVGTS